jgi:3-phosphoinositide dependent protein kinase-1
MMEKKLLSAFDCPLILKLYSSFQDEDYLYMVMDLCTGGELLHMIQKTRDTNKLNGIEDVACDLPSCQYYAGSVILALEYLHSHKIVHRDMKPENVLLTGTGAIQVGDFGTALDLRNESKVAASDTSEVRHNSFVGTAEYVSPEVLQNLEATPCIDLWALGCMVFQMLVGRPPFQAPNEYTMFNKIIGHANGSDPIVYPSSMSADGIDFVNSLLTMDPLSRLGASDGVGDGVIEEYTSIRSHALFKGFDLEGF